MVSADSDIFTWLSAQIFTTYPIYTLDPYFTYYHCKTDNKAIIFSCLFLLNLPGNLKEQASIELERAFGRAFLTIHHEDRNCRRSNMD